MPAKIRYGKKPQWKIYAEDERGFLFGIHFNRDRKLSKAALKIIKDALEVAAAGLDDLANSNKPPNNQVQPASGQALGRAGNHEAGSAATRG